MSNAPLMPKATAVWLVENTSLTFEQIANFCKLHPLEVKGIADGEVAAGIKGHDPITSGQLTREEIAAAEVDEKHQLILSGLEGASAGTEPQAWCPLHALVPKAGSSERDSLAHPQSSGAQGRADYASCRHHKNDIARRPRPDALEFRRADANRSRHTWALFANGSRFGSQPCLQGSSSC